MEEDQRTKTFSSLRYGTEYCVSIMMEGSGSLSASNLSPKQCLRLPEQGKNVNTVMMTHELIYALK